MAWQSTRPEGISISHPGSIDLVLMLTYIDGFYPRTHDCGFALIQVLHQVLLLSSIRSDVIEHRHKKITRAVNLKLSFGLAVSFACSFTGTLPCLAAKQEQKGL